MLLPPFAVPVVLAYAALAVVGVVLSVVDVRTHRLPNRIVLPMYPALAVLLTLACLLGAPWSSLGRAAAGGALSFAFFWVLWRCGGGIGGGDVKLAGVLGAAAAWVAAEALAIGVLSAFVLGGVFSLALLALRRARRGTAVPFGPFLVAGMWIGIALGAPR
ncbi:prepilin peptidase [Microbacterium sp. No. 7]|uniref:prepilin peptidase n=1 Tax=Microbacterium sp. No. 7 TaxID=1714373 RepID=UPI0006D2C247|nr:prepilin peptidase [Microbacterium sp. No. 7]ALJ20842.1 peptidase A24 [Microbacterium sp. No. 7]